MEAFTTKGHWWLPGNRPDDAVAGILTFDPSGQSELDLFGSLTDGAAWARGETSEAIILGIGDKGQAITLVDCLWTHLRSGGSTNGYIRRTSKYLPHVVIQGYLYDRAEQISFEDLWIRFYGLEKWAATGKIWDADDLDSPASNYSTEDDIAISLDGFELTIRRGHVWSGNPYTSLAVERHAEIKIVPAIPWGLPEVTSSIFALQVFLSLGMGTPTWPVEIYATNPDNEKRTITLHYFPYTEYKENDHLSEYAMVFTLNELDSQLESCLRNWFAISESLGQVFFLYNLTISYKKTLTDTFLSLAKAIEVYHRQRSNKKFVDENEFAEIYNVLKSNIPEGIDERLKQRITDTLKWSNEPSLRGRLKSIRDTHQYRSDQLFKNYNSFVQNVVGHRNYLTHFDEEGKPDTNLKDVIVPMCERLKYILEICLLSELGLDEENIQQMVNNLGRANPTSHVLFPPQSES